MPPQSSADEDEFTELVDAQFDRVDLVGKGANGVPRFLIAKSADGALLEPGFVRELIGEREPVAKEERVTMTGSPAALAKLIHEAAQRPARPADDVAKAEMSRKSINDLPDSAFAYIEPGGKKDESGKTTPRKLRHFPIHDKAHADNAAARIAQGAEFGDKAAGKVHAAQRKFGEKVSKEADVADPVAKDMGPELDEGVDGMDPTVPLAAPEDDLPGDPTDPGSPAWEAIDAATAQKWTSIAVRLKTALGVMAERELIEAASENGDGDDAGAAFDLQDAMCAVDYVIDTLACFAAGEDAEATLGAEAMEAIGKALAGFDPASLDVVEGLCGVAKAGRVLSAVNEGHLRTAAQSLQAVLSSLPSAPIADDQVTKEAAMAAETTPEATPAAQAPVEAPAAPEAVTKEDAAASGPQDAPESAPEAPVAKAEDGEDEKVAAMMPVYDADGNLCGVVDPANVTPLQGAKGKTDADDGNPADGEADPQAPAGDMTPAPSADAGTPAEGVAKGEDQPEATEPVAKAADETSPDDSGDAHAVLKSIVTEALTEKFGAETAVMVSKADFDAVVAELDEVKKRLGTVEEQPAAPKVFANGQTPPPGTLRGQDATPGGAPVIDVAKAAERRRELYRAPDATEQNKIALEMQGEAIAALAAKHAAPRV